MKQFRNLGLLQLFLLLYVVPSYGHPSLIGNAHPHDSNTVKWEQDGSKDGDSAHNHVSNNDFGGAFDLGHFPYSAFGCWDNRFYRDDQSGSFDKGHCFINESSTTNVVRYSLPTNMPSGAKSRVRDAFDAWSEISLTFGNVVGIEFVE